MARKSPRPGKPYKWGVEMVAKGLMTAEALKKAIDSGEIRPDPTERDLGPDTGNYQALRQACQRATVASRENGGNRLFSVVVREPKPGQET